MGFTRVEASPQGAGLDAVIAAAGEKETRAVNLLL
jgi:hypothetical protein